MKTYMAHAETVERKWYVVDATDMPLGRLASQVASILRGKNKAIFTPHVDTGDHVIVINCDKVVLTGNKLEDKIYYHHTGYVGGLKEVGYDTLMRTNSKLAFEKAVEIGVDGIEMDVHLTKDNELVIIHDEDIKRTCDGEGLVKDINKQVETGVWDALYRVSGISSFEFNKTLKLFIILALK